MSDAVRETCIVPDWDAPKGVRAFTTTRIGGVNCGGVDRGGASSGSYASFNLALHVGDEPRAVAANRARLQERLPAPPLWLSQIHGIRAVDEAEWRSDIAADACVARRPHRVCAVLTADCLPVLLCDRNGGLVAAAHAGWRGLAAGILEATLARMNVDPARVVAWLGPAIGREVYEVGAEVREAFIGRDRQAAAAFSLRAADKWLCDLALLARQRLHALGVARVFGGEHCSFTDRRFYSHRRDGVTGRMASLIWIE